MLPGGQYAGRFKRGLNEVLPEGFGAARQHNNFCINQCPLGPTSRVRESETTLAGVVAWDAQEVWDSPTPPSGAGFSISLDFEEWL
jgi:hypothetical protein